MCAPWQAAKLAPLPDSHSFFNPVGKCMLVCIELGVIYSQRTLQTAFRRRAIHPGLPMEAGGSFHLPVQMCGVVSGLHGAQRGLVSHARGGRGPPVAVLGRLGLRACRRRVSAARPPRARESGGCAWPLLLHGPGGWTAALRVGAVHMAVSLSSQALLPAASCCRRVVSAGTLWRSAESCRAPSPFSRAQGHRPCFARCSSLGNNLLLLR
jgi:hypothetical protein